MSKLSKLIRKIIIEQGSVNFFYLILGLALFIGDGKQPIVDIFLCFSIPIWSLFIQIYKPKLRLVPSNIIYGFITFILFIFVKLFFSISPGLSFSYLVRILLSFVSFYTWYCYLPQNQINHFYRNLIIFVTFASACSLFLIIFPDFGKLMPSTNLIYASFGHNHLSGLILFILPFAISKLLNSLKIYEIIWLIFIILMFILSFGRLALLFASIYLLFTIFKNQKNITFKNKIHLIVIVLIFLISIFLIFLNSTILTKNLAQKTIQNTWLNRQVNKSFSLMTLRGNYWQQAISAFYKAPFTGHGPGTFSLLSKNFQITPDTYSYYAHNFFLEFLSENGIIGVLILSYLFFVIIKKIKTNYQLTINNYQLTGILLVFAYSFVDYNLSFIVIWLLFWSSLAILSINKSHQKSEIRNLESLPTQAGGIYFFIFLLLFFYLTALSSLVITVPNNIRAKTIAFYLAPYDELRAKNLIEFAIDHNLNLSANQLNLINFFHQKNPEILFDKIKYLSNQNHFENLNQLYVQLILTDPKNWTYHAHYLIFLNDEKKYPEVYNELKFLSQNFVSQKFQNQINQIDFQNSIFIDILFNKITLVNTNYEPTILLAKLFYLVGFDTLNTDLDKSQFFMSLARDLAPTWGYFHMELAALSYYKLNDIPKTHEILTNCQKFEYVRSWCQEVNKDLTKIPKIGSLKENILAIPQILK